MGLGEMEMEGRGEVEAGALVLRHEAQDSECAIGARGGH